MRNENENLLKFQKISFRSNLMNQKKCARGEKYNTIAEKL